MRTALPALAAGLLLSLCPASPAQVPTPDPAPNPPPVLHQVEPRVDVAFARIGEREMLCDIYIPGEGAAPFPVIVCLHGGGWIHGDRKSMTETARTLAARGYVAVAPDYRLAPNDPFPAALEDCKAVVRFLRAHADDFHCNPDRVGVLGFSSGAHLACLLGLTDPSDGLEGEGGSATQSSRVQAVVAFSPPTDLTTAEWSPVVARTNLLPFLGGTLADRADAYRRASPVTYADRKGQPPVLVFHSNTDPIVRPEQSKRFVEKLQRAGNAAQLINIEADGHVWRGPALARSLQLMVDFFDKQLKNSH